MRWNGVYSIFERITILASTFIVARLVGPGPFGDFAIAVGVSAVVGQLVETGAAQGLVHRKRIWPATTSAHTQVQIISALLRLGLAIVVLAPVSSLFGSDVAELLLGLSLIQLIWAFGITPRVLMEKRLDFKRIAFVDGVALLLSSVGGVLAAEAGWGRYALLVGGTEPALILYTVQALGNLAVGPHQERTRAWVSVREVRWFLGFARGFWLQAQFVPVVLHWDRLVIGYFFGPVQAGLYDVAGRIAYLPTRFVQQFIGRVMLPYYAQIQSDKARIGMLLTRQLQAAGYLVTIFFIVFLLADWAGAVPLILGQDWQSIGVFVLGLSIAGWLRVVVFTLWPAIVGTGQTWALVRYTAIVAVLAFIAVPVLAVAYGVAGVLIGVTFATAIGTVALLRTMDPPWAGHPRTVPAILLVTSLGLLIGFASTVVIPRADVWIISVTATLLVALSLAGRKTAILNLLSQLSGSSRGSWDG